MFSSNSKSTSVRSLKCKYWYPCFKKCCHRDSGIHSIAVAYTPAAGGRVWAVNSQPDRVIKECFAPPSRYRSVGTSAYGHRRCMFSQRPPLWLGFSFHLNLLLNRCSPLQNKHPPALLFFLPFSFVQLFVSSQFRNERQGKKGAVFCFVLFFVFLIELRVQPRFMQVFVQLLMRFWTFMCMFPD